MWPYLIPALIQGGGAALKYATRRKTPSFGSTPYGGYLRRIGREGRYSPRVRRGFIGQISSQAGNIAQQERARMRGFLEASGRGGSVAGTRRLEQPGLQRMRSVASAGERLELENEMSKMTAKEAFARLSSESQMQRSGEKSQAILELLGGLAGAGVKGYQGYQAAQLGEEYGERYPGIKPYIKASQAGMQLPYYSARDIFKEGEEPPDFHTMSESQILEWVMNQRDPELAYEMLINAGVFE